MLINENNRCLILFHLLVPGGKWHTVILIFLWLASSCSSRFQRCERYPLLPPLSAQISKPFAFGYRLFPIHLHHWRILSTANSAVSPSIPTVTHPVFLPIS